jgi:hypothetical protein
MFSKEVIALLIDVITSWQVIAVTIGVVLYMSLVSFVAQTYRRPRAISLSPAKPKKKKKEAAAAAPAGETESEDEINDELGLEES